MFFTIETSDSVEELNRLYTLQWFFFPQSGTDHTALIDCIFYSLIFFWVIEILKTQHNKSNDITIYNIKFTVFDERENTSYRNCWKLINPETH